ncbi:hypothetical protein OHV05_36655 (plasmid) [Kitasatospora sp. NBC_00070]|uniref:terpene synthase family protein n=1 Tax=Kitasatospora sp. NBC_00070 TaxID=2975962 RepID=UPI002F913B98
MPDETASAATMEPPLKLPFPLRLNTHYSAVPGYLEDWTGNWTIVPERSRRSWRSARFDLLVGHMYPDAFEDLLRINSEAVLWLFLYGDRFDLGPTGRDTSGARTFTRQVRDILLEPIAPAPVDRLLRCIARFRYDLDRVPHPGTGRVKQALAEFSDSILSELARRNAVGPPSEPEYLAKRRLTSGWQVLTALVELDFRYELPSGLRSCPEHAVLSAAACDITCAVNDILTLGEEASVGAEHNLVMILARERGIPLDEALDLALGRIAERLEDYAAAKEAFLISSTADRAGSHRRALRYASALESLMRGSLDWSLETGRYKMGVARSEA